MQDPRNRYRAFGLLLLFGSIVTLAALWNFYEEER